MICKVVNLPTYRYWHYHAVSRMPAWMVDLLDDYDMRAVYELYTAWEKFDEDGRLYLKATVESTRETTPTWELTTAAVKHIVKNRPAINDLHFVSDESDGETGDDGAAEPPSKPRRRTVVLAAMKLPSKVPSDLLRKVIATLKPAEQKRVWALVQGELDLSVPGKVKP
jgi:hypothetical protein